MRRIGATNAAPSRISASARDLFASNVLFVFVRATDTMRVLRPFVNELDPSCVIVSLQNGIQTEDAVKAALGSNVALVIGATTESALTLAPGSAAPVGIGTTIVGPGGASPEVCARIARLLNDAGMAASVAYDIRPHLWGKLIANAAINPVAALLDRPNGIILEDANAGELARSLAQEAATVAGAMRIALPFSDPWATFARSSSRRRTCATRCWPICSGARRRKTITSTAPSWRRGGALPYRHPTTTPCSVSSGHVKRWPKNNRKIDRLLACIFAKTLPIARCFSRMIGAIRLS